MLCFPFLIEQDCHARPPPNIFSYTYMTTRAVFNVGLNFLKLNEAYPKLISLALTMYDYFSRLALAFHGRLNDIKREKKKIIIFEFL